jgi:hypothetical protein
MVFDQDDRAAYFPALLRWKDLQCEADALSTTVLRWKIRMESVASTAIQVTEPPRAHVFADFFDIPAVWARAE